MHYVCTKNKSFGVCQVQKIREAAMRYLTSVTLITVLWLLGAATPASADHRLVAKGEFTATVDFSTLTLTPVGDDCLLVVEGLIEFTGTLEGIAPARTRALVLATCDEVAVNPPGAFKDVFSSQLEFAGRVNGNPTIADITYRGVTEVGGGIEALFVASNGLRGVLKVDAIVAVGGTYKGFLRAKESD